MNGIKVVESSAIQELPKLALSDKCPCSERVRKEFNAWLLEQFGTYLPTYALGAGTIVMHPKHVAMLKERAGNVE